MKSPAFQFYPKDWLSSTDISLMTPEQEGAYIRLICHMWDDEDCSLPDDDQKLAQLSRLGDRWGDLMEPIKSAFMHHPKKANFFSHERLLAERKNQKKNRKKKQDAAKKRWDRVKQADASALQTQCPSSSSSSSSSTALNKNITEAKASPPKFSKDHFATAQELWEIIVEKYPHYAKKPPNLDNWAVTIRKIQDIDGFSIRQIEQVAEWALLKSPFWSKQIRSPNNLREHFNKLIDQSGLHEKWKKEANNGY